MTKYLSSEPFSVNVGGEAYGSGWDAIWGERECGKDCNICASLNPPPPVPPVVLREVQEEVAYWREHNFPQAKSYQQLLGVAEEVGELCRAHLKAEQGIRGTPAQWVEAKKDAVGDILIYLLNYCSLEGLKVEDCLNVALEEIRKRDWVRFPGDGRTR